MVTYCTHFYVVFFSHSRAYLETCFILVDNVLHPFSSISHPFPTGTLCFITLYRFNIPYLTRGLFTDSVVVLFLVVFGFVFCYYKVYDGECPYMYTF